MYFKNSCLFIDREYYCLALIIRCSQEEQFKEKHTMKANQSEI